MYVGAIVYYLFIYVIYKTQDFTLVSTTSYCGGTNKCMKAVSKYNVSYKVSINDYSNLIHTKMFGSEIDYPEKDKYITKFYEASISSDPISNIREVYIELLLYLSKLSGFDDTKRGLNNNVLKSITFNIEKFNFNLEDVADEKYNEMAEIVYFKSLMDYNADYFNITLFCNRDSYDYTTFYDILNEKYFNSKLENNEIEYLVNNFDPYNMETYLLTHIITSSIIQHFNKEFMINYSDAFDAEDIVSRMEEKSVVKYDVFDIIYQLTDSLSRDDKFKYRYDWSEKEIKSFDFYSIYEDSKYLAEAIYNLMYDFYDMIYSIYMKNKDQENEFNDITYHFEPEEEEIILCKRNNSIIGILRNEDFVNSIYNPLLSLFVQNSNNKYISKSMDLANELYNYLLNDNELKKIKKESYIKESNDIEYEIDDNYDVIFKENTYMYLIENHDYYAYLDNLERYIIKSCENFNDSEDSNIMKPISALELVDNYNLYYSNVLIYSNVCNKNYREIYESEENKTVESIEK